MSFQDEAEGVLTLDTECAMEVFSKIQEEQALETPKEDDKQTHSVHESPAWSTRVISLPPQVNGRLFKIYSYLVIYVFFVEDTEKQIKTFKERFAQLQERAKAELAHRSINTINRKLMGALPQRLEKEYKKYILTKRGRKQTNVEELFDDLSDYCWSTFEYELLQFVIISNNCHPSLRNAMEQYANDVQHLKHSMTASRFMKLKHEFLMKISVPRGYRRLKVVHSTNPEEFTLADVDCFRDDIWSESISEEFSYPLITFFCDENGKELLQQHHICRISIDDALINQSVGYICSYNMS